MQLSHDYALPKNAINANGAVAQRCRVPDVVDDQIGGYAEGTSQDFYSTTLSVT